MIKKRNRASKQSRRERQREREREGGRDLLEKTFWTKDKGITFPFSFKCLEK